MLKKCLLAIAVVAFLAAIVQADTRQYKGDPWPTVYKPVEMCTIPVYIEVGWWIEIKDCQDLEITLEQVNCSELEIVNKDADDWPCYEGCEKFKVRTNFEAELDLEFDHDSDIINKHDEGIFNETSGDWEDPFIVSPDADWQEFEICINAWVVERWESTADAGDDEKVGDLIIWVVPTGTP